MIYRVTCDGKEFYDTRYKDLTLIDTKVTNEFNAVGSFEFTMPPMHRFYSDVMPLKSTVFVYKDDDIIFTGRPIEFKNNFKKEQEIYCESAIAYLHDSIQEPVEFNSTTVKKWLQYLLNNHNAQVQDDRKIYLGRVTADPDTTIYRKIDRSDTYWSINHMVELRGGYFMTRYEDGKTYLDYLSLNTLKENKVNQPIEFGRNLLDYTRDFNLDEVCTCVIPLGDTLEDESEPLNVASVNGGSMVVENADLIEKYGRITQVVTFEGFRNARTLLQRAKLYLTDLQWTNLEITATAAELHFLNPNWDKFLLGQYVHVISKPHGLDTWYPLTKIETELYQGEETVTLGNVQKKALSEQVKEASRTSETDEKYDELDSKYDDLSDDYDDLNDKYDDLNDKYDDTSSKYDSLSSDVSDLKESTSGWIHQINGNDDGQQHTVNFIIYEKDSREN